MNETKKPSVTTNLVSAYDLFKAPIKPRRFLVEGLIPAESICMLVGPSDTGKSIFARQLASSIALSKNEFIGMRLNRNHGKVIYISTEDGRSDWQEKLHKLDLSKEEVDALRNMSVIFPDEEFGAHKLEEVLKNNPADLIVVDVLSDAIGDKDLNSTTVVRSYFKPYKALVEKYDCSVLFVHHVSKKAENNGPHKSNVLGSQALESACRATFELRRGNNNERTLTITKGNYFADEVKSQAITLELDPATLEFDRTGTISSRGLSPQTVATPEIQVKVMELHQQGVSLRKIEKELKASGLQISKSTVANIINDLQKSGDVQCPAA